MHVILHVAVDVETAVRFDDNVPSTAWVWDRMLYSWHHTEHVLTAPVIQAFFVDAVVPV